MEQLPHLNNLYVKNYTNIWNQFSMELQIWDWGITSNVSQMREISGSSYLSFMNSRRMITGWENTCTKCDSMDSSRFVTVIELIRMYDRRGEKSLYHTNKLYLPIYPTFKKLSTNVAQGLRRCMVLIRSLLSFCMVPHIYPRFFSFLKMNKCVWEEQDKKSNVFRNYVND